MNEVLTKEDFKAALTRLGVKKGMLLYVQSSLRSINYVAGGAQSVIDALMEVVGYDGTIVMHAPTRNLCDPSDNKKNIPRDRYEEVRLSMPAFNKKLSAPVGVSEVVTQFMRNEGVLRSNHPMSSFLAWGKYAKILVDKHPLHFGMNQQSPLGKIREYNGYGILINLGLDKCDFFDLAQYTLMKEPIRIYACPIEKSGTTTWIKLLDLEIDRLINKEIAAFMEEKQVVSSTYLGKSTCYFYSAKEAENCALAVLSK